MTYYPRAIRRTMWKRLRILWLLWCVSRKHKSQRFGQVLHNYGLHLGNGRFLPLFYAEDWRIIANLKEEIHE